MATEFKRLNEYDIKPLADGDYYTTVSGTSIYRTSIQDMVNKAKTASMTEWDSRRLNQLTDGVFYVFQHHQSNSSNFKVMEMASQYAGRVSQNLIGISISVPGKTLIVAPTQIELPWTKGSTSRIGANVSKIDAQADMNGKSKTAAIVTALGPGADYAAGYCNSYSRANAEGEGSLAGSWWLPSIGELMLINAFRQRINILLALKEGYTQIGRTTFISSTETGDSNYLSFSTEYGTLVSRSKTGPYMVLPVTDYFV